MPLPEKTYYTIVNINETANLPNQQFIGEEQLFHWWQWMKIIKFQRKI